MAPSYSARALFLAGLTLFPSATDAAGKIQAYLASLSGRATVVGIHNDQKTGGVAYYTDRMRDLSGKAPGLWGGDFSYDAARVGNRGAMIREAVRQWRQGALINIMWHACPPTVGEPCDWDADIHARLSDAQWVDLVTDGGKLNLAWKRRMDGILPFLSALQDSGAEALFRPQHEMNQGNFWWGGRKGPGGTAALFRLTRDYMEGKGIRNLAWTWDVQDLDWEWAEYDPGREYWDVFALDVYESGYTDSLYRSMLRIAGDKPIALGEVAKFPTAAELAKQPRWVFVMGWAYMALEKNSRADLTALCGATNVVTMSGMPGWENVGLARTARETAGKPIRAAFTADGRLVPLHTPGFEVGQLFHPRLP
jgi:hypothetical protein